MNLKTILGFRKKKTCLCLYMCYTKCVYLYERNEHFYTAKPSSPRKKDVFPFTQLYMCTS